MQTEALRTLYSQFNKKIFYEDTEHARHRLRAHGPENIPKAVHSHKHKTHECQDPVTKLTSPIKVTGS